jgi:transposase
MKMSVPFWRLSLRKAPIGENGIERKPLPCLPLLTDEQRHKLKQWAEAEALSSRELLSRLKENGVAKVSQRTLQMELKRMGFIWKRTRYSLKKNATPTDSSK